MQVVIILFSAVKSMQKTLADNTFCVCIATSVDFSIQVQMTQWKIVWLPVWIKCDILSGVVLYLVRVLLDIHLLSYAPLNFVSSSFSDKIVTAL